MTIEDIQRINCNMLIPSKWNVYKWSEKHPDTTIAHAMKRIEKIFDFSDSVEIGVSGGKDSTVTANLACLELNLRHLRARNGIKRDGTRGVDILDKKWNGKRIHSCSTNAEVVFSDTNNYIRRFLSKFGPQKMYTLGEKDYKFDQLITLKDGSKDSAERIFNRVMTGEEVNTSEESFNHENCVQIGGFDLIEHNEICFPMSWQSGVSFDSGILISWAPDKVDQWVQNMPTREELHGFDCVNFDNRNTANAVPLSSLSEKAQKWHIDNGTFFYCKDVDLFQPYQTNRFDKQIKAVANFGRGPFLPNLKAAVHEKEEQDEYSYQFAQTSWLLDNRTEEEFKECNERLQELYDLSENVWTFTPAKVSDDGVPEEFKERTISTCLISLRAEESLDRRVILSQGEYSTGQYSNNQGTNVCSPVFDFPTTDIWRLLSATDWDVNDVYEKLYEIGIGIGDQRVGSLLNYAAVRQISTVKALEPDLYAKINARFQNVEFMAQFNKSGYFKIGKPKDAYWDGHNHIKAGRDQEDITNLSNRYENVLKKLEIPYERKGNEFWTADPKLKGKPWYPLKEWSKKHGLTQ